MTRAAGATAPIRVAVISSVHRWNDTRIFVKQAASLAAAGYEVTLIAIDDRRAQFDAGGFRVVTLPRRRRVMRWRTWWSIFRLVMAERAGVVHAHDPELVPLVLLMQLMGRTGIVDVHENVAEQVLFKEWIPAAARRPLSWVLKRLQRALPYLADAVVLAEDSYVRDYGPAANVVVVRNFPLLPPEFKEDYHSDVLRLIYVGDVRRVRGIGEYVAITARLSQLGIPVELRVVGSFADPREEQEIRDEVQRLGLAHRVKLLGRRPPEEVPTLVRNSDVGLALLHAIGNYRESYPTKMFEYMAAGVPVVASNFTLWSEVLVTNDCGRVVDPLDVEAAAALLREYWFSPELRERHGRNGRAAVARRYSWNLEVPSLLHAYASAHKS